ncbi:hypothetical protein QTP88_005730 [Uroleucon formosanum]
MVHNLKTLITTQVYLMPRSKSSTYKCVQFSIRNFFRSTLILYNIVMLADPRISLKLQCEYCVFSLPMLHACIIVVTPKGKKTVSCSPLPMGVGAVWYDITLVFERGCPFGLYGPPPPSLMSVAG